MPLREFLQKKDQINKGHGNYHSTTGLPSSTVNPVPEIRFVAPDPAPTTSNIPPSRPTYDDGIESDVDHQSASRYNRLNLGPSPDPSPRRKSLSLLHRSSRSRSPSESSTGAPQSESPPQSRPRRLSNLLHRGNSRSPSPVSAHIPADLPQIDDNGKGDAQHKEAQWEKRATVLVQNPPLGSPGLSPNSPYGREQGAPMRARSSSRGVVADRDGDVNIQEAIRLHEIGELEASTKMFGKLADPNGVNNALSQVLYGLALRHGWGCTTDPEKAISYLSAAASNSASVESEALQAGIKKGGAAKGELVLAIFELANCFRNGWGVAKDPVAARQYFETAANLGDTDALNEAAWCYLEGFGGKKDKFLAAKYYRLAEEKGNKLVGNSWTRLT